jgi:hypothetical protein
VCLQTSIARHLAQSRSQKNSDGTKPSSATKLEKPMATIQPVVHRDSLDSSSSDSLVSDVISCATDSKTSISENERTSFNPEGIVNADEDLSEFQFKRTTFGCELSMLLLRDFTPITSFFCDESISVLITELAPELENEAPGGCSKCLRAKIL